MQFLSTVCVAAICMAIFRMLIPENKFQKQISVLVACVFLLTGITAVSGAEIDLDEDSFELGINTDYISFSGEVNEQLKKKICDDMRDKIRNLLNENEIYPEEIHIIVNISGLYSIDITQVELVFRAEEQDAATAAAELLSRELSEDVKIKIIVK
ncbi:MAG: hypothetical protein K2N56_11750 [Oscillospiraceae bacterium]|nr:hypothetical protein [Oscillospiraceae bacterium]